MSSDKSPKESKINRMTETPMSPEDLPRTAWEDVHNPTQERTREQVLADAERDDVQPGDEVRPS